MPVGLDPSDEDDEGVEGALGVALGVALPVGVGVGLAVELHDAVGVADNVALGELVTVMPVEHVADAVGVELRVGAEVGDAEGVAHVPLLVQPTQDSQE